ncbi:MAG: hypothetical protein MUC38_03065 [Cyclobacteriaceae bacterium]|jgi:uncharacterized membrane protein YphA (DoxX/SURF4 family)|nr:hypothetical protein [Cyclobacteriaceae bacterium]
MKTLFSRIVHMALAVPMIIFGLNKFLLFADVPPPAGAQAQAFLGALFTSYLAPLVGATEIIAGVLLLFSRTAFMGTLWLLPVTVNIAVFHVAHDLPGNGIWIVTTLLHGLVCYDQRESFRQLVNI